MFTLANFAVLALAASIAAQDPFQNPVQLPCISSSRILTSYDYRIADDVVMEYWESRDDVLWWTPLCSFRSDIVRVGRE